MGFYESKLGGVYSGYKCDTDLDHSSHVQVLGGLPKGKYLVILHAVILDKETKTKWGGSIYVDINGSGSNYTDATSPYANDLCWQLGNGGTRADASRVVDLPATTNTIGFYNGAGFAKDDAYIRGAKIQAIKLS